MTNYYNRKQDMDEADSVIVLPLPLRLRMLSRINLPIGDEAADLLEQQATELDEWRHGERTYSNYNEDYKDMCRKAVAAEQEVARLSQAALRLAQDNTRLEAHIRAIAEHHSDGEEYVRSHSEEFADPENDINYHDDRRDFALSGLKEKTDG